MNYMLAGPKGGLHNDPLTTQGRSQHFLKLIIKRSIFTKASCENFTEDFLGEAEDVIYIANARVFHKKTHLDLSLFPSLSFCQ